MSYRVRVSPQATAQIRDAASWWLENRAKAPDAFAEEIERTFELVRSLPSAGEPVLHPSLEGLRSLPEPSNLRTPLTGLRVVVTRAETQGAGLLAAFAAAGAEVAALPLLAVVPPADPRPLERAASELALYDWLVFTSANAVEAFLPLAGGAVPERLQVAAVGAATAAALRSFEIKPALAGPADAAALAAALAPHVARRRRVLLPQAADAAPTLVEALAAAGAEPVAIVAYDKRLPAGAPGRARALFADAPLGWVTFTSGRIVRHFAGLFGDDWERRRPELRAASIGKVTSAELARYGVVPAAEAARPGDAELVAAVIAAVTVG